MMLSPFLTDAITNQEIYLKNIPWTQSPFFTELLEKSHYDEETKKQIKFFSENGYLVIDPKIDTFPAIAKNIISSLAEEQHKHGSRVQDAWCYQNNVRQLASYPTILNWLRILYQREPIPFQTLNFSVGTEQDTHSDIIHFSSVPEHFMGGVWLALEDIDENNGALHYYPGSHRLPVFNFQSFGLKKTTLKTINENYQIYSKFIKEMIKSLNLKKETISVKKGNCLIWSANLLHGGDPIKDKTRTRHTMVTHYYFSNSRYFAPLYSDIYAGKMAWKEVIDIKTNCRVPHIYHDEVVKLPLNVKLRYFFEKRLRKQFFGRRVITMLKNTLKKS